MRRSPVIIIGHRNPDLDSVAAAVSYAELKKSIGETNVMAAVAGEVNGETRFVLDRLGIASPPVVTDVRTKVEDLLDDEPGPILCPTVSMQEAGKLFRQQSQKTLPITDREGSLMGLVTIGDIAMAFMETLSGTSDPTELGAVAQGLLQSPVKDVMRSENLVVFESNDLMDEARQTMLRSRYRNYPVLGEDGRYMGMIGRYHLLKMNRRQLILVDHNEKNQSVPGIEEAELLEVIDHHRVGDVESINPIYFRNEPVGATSTLISEMFRERGLTPEKDTAALLLSGILTDTMIFRSPTCTSRDRVMADWLASISGMEIEQWGREIFRAASPLNPENIETKIIEDMKEYNHGSLNFAVAQIETTDLDLVEKMQETIRAAMNKISRYRGYHLMFLMVTDIFIEVTLLLIAGEKASLGGAVFGDQAKDVFYLQGVLSRKKQVIPQVLGYLARQELAI